MATVWNYDGADTVVVMVDAVNGHSYHARCPQTVAGDIQTASGSTVTLTIDLSGAGFSAAEGFSIWVLHDDTHTYIAGNCFIYGTSSSTGRSYDVTWDFDGTDTVTAEFIAPNADNWSLIATYSSGTGSQSFEQGSDQVGSADTICTVTLHPTIGSEQFFVELIDSDSSNFDSIASRLFTPGASGAGIEGNPGGTGGGGGDGTSASLPTFTITNLDHDGSTISEINPVATSLKWTYRIAQSGGPGEAEWAVALSDISSADEFAPYRTDWKLTMHLADIDTDEDLIAGIMTPLNTGSEESGIFGEVRCTGKDWLHFLEQPYPFAYADVVSDVATNQLADPANLFKQWTGATQETIVGDLFDSISAYEDAPAFGPSYEGSGWSLTTDKQIAFGDNATLLDLILDIAKLGPLGGDTYGFDMWCDPDLTVHLVAPRKTSATSPTPLYTLDDSAVVNPPLDWTNNGPLATDTVTFGETANNTSRIGFDDYQASRDTYRRWVEFVNVNLQKTESIASAAAAQGHYDRFPQKNLKLTIRPDLLDPDDTGAGFRNLLGQPIAVNYDVGAYHTIDANFWIVEQSFYSPDGCNWLCDLTLSQIYDASDTPNP